MASGSVTLKRGKRVGDVFYLVLRDGSAQWWEKLGRADDGWTRRRADRALRTRLTEIERDGFRKPSGVRFDEFARRWFNDHLPARNLKPTTITNYRINIERHLIPFLGSFTLSELETRPEIVDQYVAAKMRAGLSPKTIRNTLGDLNVMLKQAVRWKLIRTNPVAGAERPRVVTPEMQILTEAEIARLRVAFDELATESPDDAWWPIVGTLVLVALGTALRRGELLALRWRDVQFLEGLLHVREAYVNGRMTTPKSRTSRRTIELGPRTAELLQARWRATAYRDDDELVFAHPEKGTPLDPSKLARCYVRPALKRAAIEKPFRPFHDLRHTALTYEAAVNPQAYVQLKAGHSQGTITERYVHAKQVLFPGAAARGEDRMFGEVLEGG